MPGRGLEVLSGGYLRKDTSHHLSDPSTFIFCTEVVKMKRIPLPSYSLSIASQENALGVNSAPGPPEHLRKASPPKLAKKGASARLRKNPATTELLSEHCFAKNALRVMCLLRGTLGSAPGWQALLPSRPAPQPGERHQGCHAEAFPGCVLRPEDFPSHAAGTAGSALTHSSPEIRFRGAGWWYFRENCEIRAASRR